MGRVLGKQLWRLARNHLNKVAKAEGLVWVINLRLIHLHRHNASKGCKIHEQETAARLTKKFTAVDDKSVQTKITQGLGITLTDRRLTVN